MANYIVDLQIEPKEKLPEPVQEIIIHVEQRDQVDAQAHCNHQWINDACAFCDAAKPQKPKGADDPVRQSEVGPLSDIMSPSFDDSNRGSQPNLQITNLSEQPTQLHTQYDPDKTRL